MKSIILMSLAAILAFACGNSHKNSQDSNITTVSVSEFAKTIQQKDVWLIDVRTAKEYAESHIGGAENIDVNQTDFIDRVKKNPRCNPEKTRVAVYCRSGKRSMKAANILAKEGFTVVNLDGGIMAWQKTMEVVK